MKQLSKVFIYLILCAIPALSLAQNGTVRGVIHDKNTGEPIGFANALLLQGTEKKMSASADVNGFFQIAQVPPGTYTLVASFVSYRPHKMEITVKANETVFRKLYLEEISTEIEELEISGEKIESQTQIKISVIKATRKEINAVPTVGGESDIATYFQTVPGVVTTGDQGGQLYVRGGSPIQNKVMLDGMIIYNPFHSIGFFSVFDTDIIRNADIYTGGYGAAYGGRISSVMDITTRDGNKNKFSGKTSVSPFGAKLLLEGPLKKLDDKGSSISYLLSGKTSYLAQTSKIFYPYVNKDTNGVTNGLPFNYTDLYGKLSFNGSNGSKFNLFGFHFVDSVKYQAISDLKWTSYGIGSNFVLVPTGNPVLIEGNFSYSHYGIGLDDGVNPRRFSEVDGFNLGFNFKYFLKRDEIKYGVEVQGFRTNFETYNVLNRPITQEINTTELSGYVTYKINRGRWLIEPGFRAQYYASMGTKFSPEPRLGAKYNINENLRIKLAAGIYSQNLISANSDRDVVNLFYGFLSGSDNLPARYVNDQGQTVERRHALQKANHLIVGFEYDLNDKLTFNVEGYYKDFTQLTNINRNKLYDENDATKPDLLKKDFIIETGKAMGIDFLAKYSTKKTYIWFVYSLGKVDRWDGVQTYAPIFDRRHNINLVMTQLFGKKEEYEISLRWNYGSGLPFTLTGGYYHNVPLTDVNTDYTSSNADDVSIIYAALNTGRLSDYHRLDLSLKRRWDFRKVIKGETPDTPDKEKITSQIEVIAGVTNMYNRRNIFYVNRINNDFVYQLPIIPTLGFNWSF